nr:MAG TPA: hypothetical protein [Caudoviricetes sp.]
MLFRHNIYHYHNHLILMVLYVHIMSNLNQMYLFAMYRSICLFFQIKN